MSQENVDKARDFIEAYNERDFERATANFDPDIDWVLPEHQASDSARGIPGVLRFFKGIDETMEELRLVPQEYVDEGDMVATRLRHFGRMEYVTSWPEALEALARGASQRSEAQT